MPAGGTLRLSVANCGLDDATAAAIPGARAGTWVRLEVSDTGTGIAPNVLEKIWTPFFTTKGGQGTGLGLSMAFGVAQAAGGALTIDSEEGRGTTVSILLPLTGQDSAPVEDDERPPVPATASSFARSILLVDDDDVVRSTVADMLAVAGHAVTAVASGAAALEVLARSRFDLLLLDYAMPGMNGAELAERALAARPDQRIIFISGYSDSAAIDAVVDGRSRILAKTATA